MIPVTDTTLYLKQMDFSSRNYGELDIVKLLFPSFIDPIISLEDFQWRLFGEIKPNMESSFKDVTLSTESRRRFDGGETLSYNCYYSVCNDLAGNDRYTLRNELYGYNDFDTSGVITIFDFAIEESRRSFLSQKLNYSAHHDGVYIMAVDNEINKSPFIEEWLKAGLFTLRSIKHPHLRYAVAHFPYTVEEVNCENILDLRQRRAQQWLVAELKSFGIVDSKFRSCEKYNWFYALSLIMEDLHGGNIVTSRIGAILRNAGIRGLVFPSARSNCNVTYDKNELVDFKGWNYVKYDSSISNYERKIEGSNVIPRFDPDHFDLTEDIENGWYLNGIEEPFFDGLEKKARKVFL